MLLIRRNGFHIEEDHPETARLQPFNPGPHRRGVRKRRGRNGVQTYFTSLQNDK
jgi:hypothetical protein